MSCGKFLARNKARFTSRWLAGHKGYVHFKIFGCLFGKRQQKLVLVFFFVCLHFLMEECKQIDNNDLFTQALQMLVQANRWAKQEKTTKQRQFRQEEPRNQIWTQQLNRRYERKRGLRTEEQYWGVACRERPINNATECEQKGLASKERYANECAYSPNPWSFGWTGTCVPNERQWEDAYFALLRFDSNNNSAATATSSLPAFSSRGGSGAPLRPYAAYIEDLLGAIGAAIGRPASFSIRRSSRADQQALLFAFLYLTYLGVKRVPVPVSAAAALASNKSLDDMQDIKDIGHGETKEEEEESKNPPNNAPLLVAVTMHRPLIGDLFSRGQALYTLIATNQLLDMPMPFSWRFLQLQVAAIAEVPPSSPPALVIASAPPSTSAPYSRPSSGSASALASSSRLGRILPNLLLASATLGGVGAVGSDAAAAAGATPSSSSSAVATLPVAKVLFPTTTAAAAGDIAVFAPSSVPASGYGGTPSSSSSSSSSVVYTASSLDIDTIRNFEKFYTYTRGVIDKFVDDWNAFFGITSTPATRTTQMLQHDLMQAFIEPLSDVINALRYQIVQDTIRQLQAERKLVPAELISMRNTARNQVHDGNLILYVSEQGLLDELNNVYQNILKGDRPLLFSKLESSVFTDLVKTSLKFYQVRKPNLSTQQFEETVQNFAMLSVMADYYNELVVFAERHRGGLAGDAGDLLAELSRTPLIGLTSIEPTFAKINALLNIPLEQQGAALITVTKVITQVEAQEREVSRQRILEIATRLYNVNHNITSELRTQTAISELYRTAVVPKSVFDQVLSYNLSTTLAGVGITALLVFLATVTRGCAGRGSRSSGGAGSASATTVIISNNNLPTTPPIQQQPTPPFVAITTPASVSLTDKFLNVLMQIKGDTYAVASEALVSIFDPNPTLLTRDEVRWAKINEHKWTEAEIDEARALLTINNDSRTRSFFKSKTKPHITAALNLLS